MAIGFGTTKKADIDWVDCQKKGARKYVKPPYWVDQSDNCELKAEGFGLRKLGTSYTAENTDQLSRLFPDAKRGDTVEFEDVSSEMLLVLKFRGRPLYLPYGNAPSEEQIASNELNVATGLANIKRYDESTGLLKEVDAVLTSNRTERKFAPTAFFAGTSASLRDVTYTPPSISEGFHSLFLHLAEYRSSLEKVPEMNFSKGGVIEIGGIGPQLYDGNFLDFSGQKTDMIVLRPGPGGRMPQHILFKNSGFMGGRQLLDGIYWDHVTFVRTHVVFGGGMVFLRNMRFVECSFEIVNNSKGHDFLNFVVNQLPDFMVGTEHDQPPPN